ncbi:hypothetical protein HELRODRAFT_107643 [Helobdella robusta]|uniref:Protein ARV n=1 Tax=Helobdella robusta TaxID=6412 RepID=T1EEB9_HELRO|nr:hypothetical protein HELRODRAFT_107643 [Helobdella robusta]ESN96694.1 hypothetical protein HELRODRAFT_107643 [Helobdella robusta]
MYECVECGYKTDCLFRKLSTEVIKLSHCENCKQPVDKYIEYDNILTGIDATLHKTQAYRHLIHNSNIKSTMKLWLVYLLCDVYVAWQSLKKMSCDDADEPYSEGVFSMLFLLAVVDWLWYVVVLFLLITLFTDVSTKDHYLRTLVLSSFGKLLSLPALIWTTMHENIYFILIQIFILTSNITALKGPPF